MVHSPRLHHYTVSKRIGAILRCLLDFLEYGMILSDSHSQQFLTPIVLVQLLVRVFLQLFHVSSDQHLSQLDEIAMFFVVDFDRSPRVRTSSYLSTIGS